MTLVQLVIAVLLVGLAYATITGLRHHYRNVHPHAHPVPKREAILVDQDVWETCRHCGHEITVIGDQWVVPPGRSDDRFCPGRHPADVGAFLPHEPVVLDPGGWL